MRPSTAYAGPACPLCRGDLGFDRLVSGRQSCPSCGEAFEAMKFTPPERRARVAQVAEAGPSGAAACSAHPANAAVTSCSRCGVFMCALCRIDVEGQALCPGCFERMSAEGALASVKVSFRDYTRIAHSLTVAGVLLSPFALAIGLAVVYYGVRSLRQKSAMGEPEGRASAVLAVVLGVVETLGGGWLLYMMFT